MHFQVGSNCDTRKAVQQYREWRKKERKQIRTYTSSDPLNHTLVSII